MDKFEQLFAEYPCVLTDELVKKNTADILAKHTAENNTREVWMQCLHQIDLTTLNGDDTTEKVATMAEKVNDFDGHFPGVPNVAAMCVYPALVETAREVLTEPIGIAAALSVSSIESSLRKMVASGELKREGVGKSTYYIRLK